MLARDRHDLVAVHAEEAFDRVRELIAVLDGWLVELERPGGPDAVEIAERLRSARERLKSMPQ